MEKIKEQAMQESLIFAYNIPSNNNSHKYCNENVYNSCVVSVDGKVGPCVFSCPTLCKNADTDNDKNPAKIYNNDNFPLSAISFGDISSESLTKIWNKEECLKFRNMFCPQRIIETDYIQPELPACCNTCCYKRWVGA